MNSSISSSETVRWGRFAATLLAAAALVLVLIIAAAYVTDPYDTGRSALLAKPGVRPQGPRTAAASRGRDQAFDAMIVGNSHIQLLSPERLKAATGVDFVQLSVPASGPKEHFVLVDWFLRHRERPVRALIMSADPMWCTSDPTLFNDKPFPYWLFSQSPLAYARGLLRYDLLEEVPRRLGYVFGFVPERARPDGYWDYEPHYLALGYESDPSFKRRLHQTPYAREQHLDRDPLEGQRRFPAAEKLASVAAGLSNEAALIVIFPPTYTNFLPPPGTEPAYLDAACKAAITAAARTHARSAVIDWRVQRPENSDPSLFFDQSHYRQPLARVIEAEVAETLAKLN